MISRHAVLVDSWLHERFSVLPDDTDFSSVESGELYSHPEQFVLVVLVVHGEPVLMKNHDVAILAARQAGPIAFGAFKNRRHEPVWNNFRLGRDPTRITILVCSHPSWCNNTGRILSWLQG